MAIKCDVEVCWLTLARLLDIRVVALGELKREKWLAVIVKPIIYSTLVQFSCYY